MSNSYGLTWAISCLSALLRVMQGRTDNCKTVIQLNDEEVSLFTDLCHISRSCYRLHELSCFLSIVSLPFYFDICCFIAVTFAFLCKWPITTEFLKGIAVFFFKINICFFWTASDQKSESSSRMIIGYQCCKIRPEIERMWHHLAEISSPIDGSPSVSY
jgi:hypothetical protein